MALTFAPLPVTNDMSQAAVDCEPVTAPFTSSSYFFRAIRANAAGTVTYTSYLGQSRTVNFLAGETRILMGSAISAATATGLEVMY